MPYLLRTIRQNRWIYSKIRNDYTWLNKAEDVPWEPFHDFIKDEDDSRNKKYEISVWLIDESNSNLDRILAALAANRDSIDVMEYVLIDKKHLDDLLLELKKEDGISKDKDANKNWHYNIKKISGLKLTKLIHKIFMMDETNRIHRKPASVVYDSLARTIYKNYINIEDLSFKNKAHIRKINDIVKELSNN